MQPPWEIMSIVPALTEDIPTAQREATADDRPRGRGQATRRLLTVSMVVSAVLFIALTLGTSLIGRTAFYGGGLLLNNAPWIADVYEPVATDNPLVGDTVDGAIPSRHEMIDRLRHGDLPGWSSRQGAGSEIGSVPTFGLLSPTAVAWWVLPADLAPGWERLTILVAAAAGLALFLRRLNVSRHAAWLGGMVYATSGFMIAWTNWPQAAVAGLLPWVLWAAERSMQVCTMASVVPVALSVAALLLGGFPALTGWVLYLTAGWVVLRLVIEIRGGPDGRFRAAAAQVGRLTLGLVLGAGVAAVQLAVFVVQFMELDTSYRAGGFSFTQPLRLALTTLFPNTWGTNVGVFFPRSNPIEGNAYLGAAAAMLCVLAVVHRPRRSTVRGARMYFAAAAALCAILVYVQGSFVAWIGQLPVFSGNPVGRLVAIMLLALSVLAGLGADAVLRPEQGEVSSLRRWAPAALVSTAGLVVLLLALLVRHRVNLVRGQDPNLAALPTTTWLMIAVASAALVVVVALLRAWRPGLAAAGFVLVPFIVAVQGVVAAAPVWEQVAADRFYPVTDMHEYLLDHIGHDRMAATGSTMVNGTPRTTGCAPQPATCSSPRRTVSSSIASRPPAG
jgi:Bacterial membrane protein YfhO